MDRPDVLPQNLEAEESVIGAMLISPNAIDAIVEVLEPDGGPKFYRDSHAKIYRVACDLHGAGHPVDAITVVDELELRGHLSDAGGRVRVYELAALVPATANASHYATIVREMWVLRAVIGCGGEVARLGWDRDGTAEEVLAKAEDIVSRIRGKLERQRDEMMTMYEAAEYLDDKFRNPPDEGYGIPTPWSFMPSLHGGRLYVLGGYEKDGKSSMAVHFLRAAISGGVKTDLVTLEMSRYDMAERIAATMGIPAKRVQTGRLDDGQKHLAARVIGDLVRYGDTGTIIDSPAADVASIRRLVQVRHPGFLIVDHLHQFALRPEYERQDLEHVVRELWRIAREYDIPVLLLAQLSRSGDKKHPFPRPTAAQLRGSGMIEKLAWAVWFVWRERDERNIATDQAEFIVALNRSGSTGIKHLVFHDRETRFTEVVREG